MVDPQAAAANTARLRRKSPAQKTAALDCRLQVGDPQFQQELRQIAVADSPKYLAILRRSGVLREVRRLGYDTGGRY